MSTPVSIFLINCDWRDIFRTAPGELREKLTRDQLDPDTNTIFLLSWSHRWYHEKRGSLETLHLPLPFMWFKPVIGDVLLVLVAPLVRWWYGVRPHVVVTYDFGFLPAARLTASFAGATLVMYVNNMPRLYSATRRLGRIKSLYSAALERLWKGLPDAFCTINTYMMNYLVDIGVPRERIYLYTVNTIAQDTAYIKCATGGVVREKFGIPRTAVLILSIGRLEAEKDHERLVRLLASVSDAHLVLAGQGSHEARIRATAKEVGVAQRVHFAGYVPRRDVWNFYRDADVFVLLSKAEALGIVFWEAMYMDVPVIGSDEPGIIESLGAHGERGIVLPRSATGRDLADAIHRSIKPSEERDARLRNAREYVRARFSARTSIGDIMRLI